MGQQELTDRQQTILELIVRHFITTAEPAGSRTIARAKVLELSPATIRNEMADLEDMGYLSQPHTSAGRVPTDKGYRLFIHSLDHNTMLHQVASRLAELESRYLRRCTEIKDLLRQAVRILSEVTRLAGMAALPDLGDSTVHRLQLLNLDPDRVLVVLVTRAGVVRSEPIPVNGYVPQDVLNHISRIFNEGFSETSVRHLYRNLTETLDRIESEYSESLRAVFLALREGLEAPEDGQSFLMDGVAELLAQPEFREADRLRGATSALFRQNLLSEALVAGAGRNEAATIGLSDPEGLLSDFSLVARHYRSRGAFGSIGILGPKRMNYPQVIVCVDHVAGTVSDILSRRPRCDEDEIDR